jgi:hypothetical protein
LAKISRVGDLTCSPREDGSSLRSGKNVRQEPRVAPVSVGEWVNPYEAVMESYCDFIAGKGLVFHPEARISKQGPQGVADLPWRNADILLGAPVCAGPSPCLIEHAAMQIANIRFCDGILQSQCARAERPIVCD